MFCAKPSANSQSAYADGISCSPGCALRHYRRPDLFESIRSAAVNEAVEQFTARVSTSPT